MALVREATIETAYGPIVGVDTPFGVIALVKPSWLDVDNGEGGYQRAYDEAWSRDIASKWENANCRPVNARLRDGRLWVTNGQHTANAAVFADVEEILVIINNGTPSRQNEAAEYDRFNTKIKRMRPFDVYRAALIALRDDALILRKVTGELGLTVAPSGNDPMTLTSITTCRDIAENGEEALRDAFEVAMTWADATRFRSDLLAGIDLALQSAPKSVVLANAARYATGEVLYRKANDEAGGKGYRTRSLIRLYLAAQPRGRTTRSVVHEA
jgi:hypothetical protein